jgi:hypothetical protein
MKKSTLTYSILLAALLGGTVSYAQQPADATKAPATAPTSTPGTASTSSTTTTTTTTTNTPSASDLMQADLLKKARSNGYHTKVRKGVVYYCKEETKIGSHFPEETCYDENGFADALQRQQSMRDSMTNHSCGNGACGGK